MLYYSLLPRLLIAALDFKTRFLNPKPRLKAGEGGGWDEARCYCMAAYPIPHCPLYLLPLSPVRVDLADGSCFFFGLLFCLYNSFALQHNTKDTQ